MLISKMGSKIWLDSIKWSKNCDFWFFRQNDENPNFWLWSAIAQKRKGFISYHHHFIHIQGICYNMTYRVFARFDPRELLTWPHFNLGHLSEMSNWSKNHGDSHSNSHSWLKFKRNCNSNSNSSKFSKNSIPIQIPIPIHESIRFSIHFFKYLAP